MKYLDAVYQRTQDHDVVVINHNAKAKNHRGCWPKPHGLWPHSPCHPPNCIKLWKICYGKERACMREDHTFHSKVLGPYSIIHLKWTPMFQWFVVRSGQKRMPYNVSIKNISDYVLIRFQSLKTRFNSHHYFILYMCVCACVCVCGWWRGS